MNTFNIPEDIKTEIMFRNHFEMWRNIYRDLGEKPVITCKADDIVKCYPMLAEYVQTCQGLRYLNLRFDDEALIHLEYYTDHLVINAVGMSDYIAIRLPYTQILGVRSMTETFVHRVDASLALFPREAYTESSPLIYGHQFTSQPAIETKLVIPHQQQRPALKLVK